MARGYHASTEEVRKELEEAERLYNSSKPFYRRVIREKADFDGGVAELELEAEEVG